jgi:hypothetical protein
MSTAKEITAVAVRTDYHQMSETVELKLKTLNGISEVQMKTNGKFYWNYEKEGKEINIHVVKNVSFLIRILGFILLQKAAYEKGVEALEAKQFEPFTWNGFPTEDWAHDIKTRCTILSYEKEKETLLHAKSVLDKYLTEDEKLQRDLEVIKVALGV